jgi:GntR family transcriptional repressor for pyruvate dehydrogenase complex
MTLKFQKPKPSRIFQNVVEQIQAAILEGRLKPGDLLPSELKLKDMFETSRGTIREALRVLEQKGLVEIKTGVGGGAVVRDVDTGKVTESLDLLIQAQKVTFDHLAEFREAVEGRVAALAAERASQKDIGRLQRILAGAANILAEPDGDPQQLVRLDVQLHITIAEIAGNPVFLAVLQMVHERILQGFERFSLKQKNVLEENYRDLCELVAAIGKGDSQAACDLARRHVCKFNAYLKKEHQPGNALTGQ